MARAKTLQRRGGDIEASAGVLEDVGYEHVAIETVEEAPCDWLALLSALVGLVGHCVEVAVWGPERAADTVSCRGVLRALDFAPVVFDLARLPLLIGEEGQLHLLKRHFVCGLRSIERFERIDPLIESVVVYERDGTQIRIGDDWKALWSASGRS